MTIEVLRCALHGFMCIAINDRRVTPGKCCGQWNSVRVWKVDGRSFMADVRKALR